MNKIPLNQVLLKINYELKVLHLFYVPMPPITHHFHFRYLFFQQNYGNEQAKKEEPLDVVLDRRTGHFDGGRHF